MMTKKEQILQSALELISEQGIESTSTAQIAKAAGVAKGTLFHHFENKSQLIDDLFKHLKQQLYNSMGETQAAEPEGLHQKMNASWNATMAWALSHPTEMRFLTQIHFHPASDNRRALASKMFANVDDSVRLGQEAGVLTEVPLELVHQFTHSHFLACASWLIEEGSSLEHELSLYIEQGFEMYWRAIGGR
ncbi:TetR/AcrR family transcriptional regulator [Vibrio maerlii]|uniref:TetR/AcrR family transcriptional regulator n=1 Tax=Vibrio maerlii TaxID=2231648 RepID=UPI000E3DB0C6|nr:TetR/AcrR family transcriptional regulator [Vibrio maerlii]